jgi:Protein of unknown function (DUF669)
MSFPHDAAAPTEGGGTRLLPTGKYELVITKVEEKKSQKGYPMVNVTCEVQNNEEFNGVKVFHNVTFLPKDKPGAGMSTHFLKSINQPWEGAVTVDPEAWKGEKFSAKISTREYDKKDGTKGKTNNIDELEGTVPF